MKRDIVRRYSQNPILTKAEIPYLVETVHNAAVVKHGENNNREQRWFRVPFQFWFSGSSESAGEVVCQGLRREPATLPLRRNL